MSTSMKEINKTIKETLSRLNPAIITNYDEYMVSGDGKSHEISDEMSPRDDSTYPKKSEVGLIYTSTSYWPFQTPPSDQHWHQHPDKAERRPPIPIRILILDSSFNPPTKAHLALASIALPSLISQSKDQAGGITADGMPQKDNAHYARLLLLSVTNADKRVKAGDATYEQRLEMMYLTAKEMEERAKMIGRSGENDNSHENVNEGGTQAGMASSSLGNVAVAAIDEPTFVGKSQKLREAVWNRLLSLVETTPSGSRFSTDYRLELYFVLGFDTVIRLFDPKFYNGSQEQMNRALDRFFNTVEAGGDDSYIICARRTLSKNDGDLPSGEGKEGNDDEKDFFSSALVSPYVHRGKVILFDFEDASLKQVSSTKARDSVRWSYSEPLEEPRGPAIEANLTRRLATYIAQSRLYLPDDGI